ncbi:hypothetical protein [Lyngbya sp. CCY1209]|uniref:hypothetical protein n=1 Tax=Lyngbya sp. CCY1209 TaxID=2886103 RepID=UPI002D1FC575|nr:hypothetical protein [Lyngbya sp. CCY1209]MEB3883034.1 hypothetical protein [Lyngbya sp. CCY1209]
MLPFPEAENLIKIVIFFDIDAIASDEARQGSHRFPESVCTAEVFRRRFRDRQVPGDFGGSPIRD